MANFFMVTSLHDGMNLVAKEFLASRSDERGVLILSLFTGASRELNHAIEINSYAIEQVSQSIETALTMSPKRQQRRMRLMREQVEHQNIYRWAGRLLMIMLRVDQFDDDNI